MAYWFFLTAKIDETQLKCTEKKYKYIHGQFQSLVQIPENPTCSHPIAHTTSNNKKHQHQTQRTLILTELPLPLYEHVSSKHINQIKWEV